MDGWKNTWQRLEEAGVPILPIERLMEQPVRDQLRQAGVVYGVDVNTQLGSVFYGTSANNSPAEMDPEQVVAFSLDFDSNDVDYLTAATRRAKGSCCRHDD
jgi:hypothetical protein